MTRLSLCLAVLLVVHLRLIDANVTTEYADCPSNCKCEKTDLNSIMSCKGLFTGNLTKDLPITKFDISYFDDPINLTSYIFYNMGLEHVNVINIVNTTIEYIDKDAFNNLPELDNIKISYSNIKYLHPETFEKIPNLMKLNLAGNTLSKDTIIKSVNLDELHLSHCNLSEISKNFFEFTPVVTFLDLSGNGISDLTSDAFDSLQKLEEINLSHNKIKQLAKAIFKNNTVLDVIDLSNNPLMTFSSKHIEGLETLNLRSCLLKEIDSNMFRNMSFLYNLYLSNNKITTIASNAFASLREIAVIDLSGNNLNGISDELFINNPELQKLILDNNNLQVLPLHGFKTPKPSFAIQYFSCNNCNLRGIPKDTFKGMTSLLKVFLSNNNINDVSTEVFQNLPNLRELDLSHNQIATISDETFIKNTNLKKINLSFNNLKALHASMFKHNGNLEYLDISNCGLYRLWTGDSKNIHIPSMKSVNASNNNIDIIKKEDLVVTNRLKALDISHNPFICKDDFKDFITYLETEDIINYDYKTHENLLYDSEVHENYENGWKTFGKTSCPELFDDENGEIEVDDDVDDGEDDDDDDIDDDDGGDDDDDEYDDNNLEEDSTDEFTTDNILFTESLKHHSNLKYSFMWPILVFLGTALVVLGLVVNVIMFVIRYRRSTTAPRLISVPRMSRLMKNSGIVYQQLSEEHNTKTPILSRFIHFPAVHKSPESEQV